jgi:hypothetical protein
VVAFTASPPSALPFTPDGATILELGGLAELKYLPPDLEEKKEYALRVLGTAVCGLATKRANIDNVQVEAN